MTGRMSLLNHRTGVSPDHLLLDFSSSCSGIPSMVPETPEQVNDARAKNHGITCLISLARVNELFENTSLTGANVNRQLFFHSSYRSNPYIWNRLFGQPLISSFNDSPIVVFEFESKTNGQCRLQTNECVFSLRQVARGSGVYVSTVKLWAKHPLFNSLFIRHRL